MRWNRVISVTSISTPQDCSRLDEIKAGQFPLPFPLSVSDKKDIYLYIYVSVCNKY